jgi:hypothetical protein
MTAIYEPMTTSSFLDAFSSVILQMPQQISRRRRIDGSMRTLGSTSCCVRLFRSSGGATLFMLAWRVVVDNFVSNESLFTPDTRLLSDSFPLANNTVAIVKEPEAPAC